MPDPLGALQQSLAGRYRIDRKLGAGGMATVYLAHDLKHDRPVALKVLDPDLQAETGTGRFSREIRLAARLQHPHICSVYDSGESDDLCWFTMPYVEGESLEARLKREGQLPVGDALRIVREAAQALAYAHSQGVVHRDIKPGNLLLARDGSTLVADFGIARSMVRGAGGVNATVTQTGFAPGTPAYMSPEQQAALDDIDGRTDIYSLGIVLYESLLGERPHAGGALAAAMARLDGGSLPRVAARRPDIPPGLDPLLNRALAFDRDQRFATMAALGDALDEVRLGRGKAAGGLMTRLTGAMRNLFATPPAPPVAPAESTKTPPTSAAVLPFRDLSPAQDQTYFSDGLAEELTTALSRIPGLKVAGRSAAFRFRGPSVDAREAGRSLGVGAVLSGSVRKSGERLRVGAQLLSVADGFELWSESYDRHLADVFRVQEEIAQSIASALRVRLGTATQAIAPVPTHDLQAYDLFLQGRFAWHQRTAQTLPEAARCFEAAVKLDPTFARAWAGVADAYTLLPPYCGTSPGIAWPRAKSAANQAISLDPRLPDAHTSLAYGTMLYEWDWVRSEQSFRRAIDADPSYQIAHHWYADFLAGRGRFEEALAAMLRARELDPLSRITGVELAWVYHLLGRHDDAEAQVRQVLRLDPAYAHGFFVLGLVQLGRNQNAEACDSIQRAIDLGGFYAHATGALVLALVRTGRRDEAEQVTADLVARSGKEYVPQSALAIAHGALGDMDQAFAALDRGIAERDVLLPENFFELLFDSLKGDPRYQAVAQLIRG